MTETRTHHGRNTCEETHAKRHKTRHERQHALDTQTEGTNNHTPHPAGDHVSRQAYACNSNLNKLTPANSNKSTNAPKKDTPHPTRDPVPIQAYACRLAHPRVPRAHRGMPRRKAAGVDAQSLDCLLVSCAMPLYTRRRRRRRRRGVRDPCHAPVHMSDCP